MDLKIQAMAKCGAELDDTLESIEDDITWAEEQQHRLNSHETETSFLADTALSGFTMKLCKDLETRVKQLLQQSGLIIEGAVEMKNTLFELQKEMSQKRKMNSEDFQWSQLVALRGLSWKNWNRLQKIEIVLQRLCDIQAVYAESRRKMLQPSDKKLELRFEDIDLQLNNLTCRKERLNRSAKHLLLEMRSLEEKEKRAIECVLKLRKKLTELEAKNNYLKNEHQLSAERLEELQNLQCTYKCDKLCSRHSEVRDTEGSEILRQYEEGLVHACMQLEKALSREQQFLDSVKDRQRNVDQVIENCQESIMSEMQPLVKKREILTRRYAWLTKEATDSVYQQNKLTVVIRDTGKLLHNGLEETTQEMEKLQNVTDCPPAANRTTEGVQNIQEGEINKIQAQSTRVATIFKLLKDVSVLPPKQLQEEIVIHLNELLEHEETSCKAATALRGNGNDSFDGDDRDNSTRELALERSRELVLKLKALIAELCDERNTVTSCHKSKVQIYNCHNNEIQHLKRNVAELRTSCDGLRKKLQAAKLAFEAMTKKQDISSGVPAH